MKEFARGLPGAFFDPRAIVGLVGIVLSIATHELFHIAIHWGEIDSISIFPDSSAIVEIIFTPTAQYNLALEEGIAYALTMITLIATTAIIFRMTDNRPSGSQRHALLADDMIKTHYASDVALANRHMAHILNIEPATR